MSIDPVPLFCGSYPEIARTCATRIADARAALPLERRFADQLLVVVPSATIGKLLAEQLFTHGANATLGVRIETIEHFAEALLVVSGQATRIATAEERLLAMHLATRTVAPDDALLKSNGIVAMLERSYRDAIDGGSSLVELKRNVQRHPNRERFAFALSIWQEYERLITTVRGTDPAAQLRRATATLAAAGAPPAIVFGFYDATRIQEEFLLALKKTGSLREIYVPVRLANGAIAQEFAFGTRLSAVLGDGSSPVSCAEGDAPAIRMLRAPRRRDEVDAICRAIASLLSRGVAPRAIGVVRRASDAQFLAMCERSARAVGFRFAAARALSLRATRIGRGLITLLRLRESEFSRGSVVELAAAGIRRSLTGISSSADRLDEVSRRCEIVRGRSAEVEPLIARSSAAGWPSAADYVTFLRFLERVTAGIPNAGPGAAWQRTLAEASAIFSVRTERDLDALRAIDEVGSRLARFETHSFSLTEVCDQLIASTITERADEGVWLGDVMHARGRRFEHLFVSGVEDDSFPQRRTEDPLLPDYVRPRFGVREIGDGEAEETMLFSLLRGQAASTITYSWATAEATGRINRPSRFLVRTALELFPDESSAIVGDFGRFVDRAFSVETSATTRAELAAARIEEGIVSPIAARALTLAASVRRRSAYDGFLPRGERFQEAIRQRLAMISPTRLERFGECPQKFLFSSLLDAKELEDPELEIEIDVRKKGHLQHAVLESFYRALSPAEIAAAAAGLSTALTHRLYAVVDRVFDEYDAEHPPANPVMRRLERERVRTGIERFVRADLGELARSGFEPRQFEFRFGDRGEDENGAPAARLRLRDIEMSIRGSIDRIDVHRTDGRVRIIDYKSGKADRLKELDRLIATGRALQLPLYALAWEQIFGQSEIEGAIRPIGAPKADAERYSFRLGETREQLLETLALFANAIIAGQFPAIPGDSCTYCAMKLSCRVLHDSEERLALRSVENPQALLREMEQQ